MSATRETVRAVVIGGGVVGCAVLRELAGAGVEALLLEAEPDVGEGASKANSAIIHTGFDAKPGTIEAGMLRRSADLWPDLLDELAVPSLACGALMLARTTDDRTRLSGIADLAGGHGVAVEIVDRAWLDEHAPWIDPQAVAALHVPNEAIVDPFWLTRAYGEAAIRLGARIRTGARVAGLRVEPDHVAIRLADGDTVRAEQALDCAGLWADDVAALAGDTSFRLTPRKGQFLVSERTYGVDRIVLPIPGPLGKGMLVTPIVFGGLLLGPTAEDGADKRDRATDDAGRAAILAATRSLVPDVSRMDPIRAFAGVRAVSSTGDYIVRPSTAGDRLTIVAGIRSTGISASPAIAAAAVALALTSRGWVAGPRRHAAAGTGPDLAADAGAIVCICRSIGSAEVDVALAGELPATTTDGLKRRAGVGFGDCQGGRCLAEAVGRIATAGGRPVGEVEKGLRGSWLVASGPTGAPGSVREPDVPTGSTGSEGALVDLAIVGGGLAGIGAALAASEGGRSVVVVDRGRVPGGASLAFAAADRTSDEQTAAGRVAESIRSGAVAWRGDATVVGLGPGDDGWDLDIAGRDGGATIRARAVILTTGAYVTPREHRAVAGPRPSGVMTADFVLEALDRGWLPARRAIVQGDGRFANGVRARMRAAGVELIAAGRSGGALVAALRGDRRLEAVQVGEDWVDVDGVVFADSVRPAAFLLRGLGIGDDRPGVAMPAGPQGALALDGLWAAGTCVAPDVDHRDSLRQGRLVGAAAAGALGTPVEAAP